MIQASFDPLLPNNVDGWIRLILGLAGISTLIMSLVYKLYILPTDKEFKRMQEEILPRFREEQKEALNGLGARVNNNNDRVTRLEERMIVIERGLDEIRIRMNGMSETLGEIKASTAASAKASQDTQVMIARFDERLKKREEE